MSPARTTRRLSALLAAGPLAAALLFGAASSPPGHESLQPRRTLHREIDPCTLAHEDRLRPILGRALAATFPVWIASRGVSLRISEPDLVELSCPDLRITVRARVRSRFGSGAGSPLAYGLVRWRSRAVARLEYRAPLGSDRPSRPCDVWAATACLGRVEILSLDLGHVPARIGTARLEDCLDGALPGWSGCRSLSSEICVDLTPQAQERIARGGGL